MTDVSKTIRHRLAKIIDTPPLGCVPRADAILAEFVVIPRADLPEVVEYGHGNLRVGESNYSSMLRLERVRTSALECLALAEHIEARDSEQAASEAKRNARRDELAREIGNNRGSEWTYNQFGSYTQRAIDRIIELEEAAA